MAAVNTVEHNNTRYRIRVSAGPDLQSLCPLNVNDDANPTLIETDTFSAKLVFRIKGQNKIQGYEEGQKQDGLKVTGDSKWFENAASAGRGANLLMSLEVVARFKGEWTGEQVVFACVFDKPFKLPALTSLAVKFFKALDPGLQLDVQGPKPYFISPLLSAMNIVNVAKDKVTTAAAPSSLPPPTWPSSNGEVLIEDTSLIIQEEDTKRKSKIAQDSSARRSYFAKAKYLSKHRFSQDQVYGFELFNPFLDCSRFSVKLPGLSLDLFKYLNEQPITYVFRTQDGGVSFLAVAVELVPVVDDLSNA